MSTEEEFYLWLRRSEKSFIENFQFALKAWQSSELPLSSKYELVLAWVTNEGQTLKNQWPVAELNSLLKLRAQPGLVSQQTKRDFVEMILSLAAGRKEGGADDNPTRLLPELLRELTEFELLQDLYRSDYEIQARVYAALLNHYESYLRRCPTLSLTKESEFFSSLMNALKEGAKRAGNADLFEKFYFTLILQPLAQVLLTLHSHALSFFDELVELERTMTEPFSEDDLLVRALELPLHVRLLVLEFSIVNRRGVEQFIKLLLQRVFVDMLSAERADNPALALIVATYTLEILRKHAVTLTFEAVENRSALAYLGETLVPYVQQFKETHLREVLMLLVAALRLNPLILEQHVFQVTTWMMFAVKSDSAVEQALFEEYLVLLLDMFRRLSQSEKLVRNLLKALKEWLQQYQLPAGLDKGKRNSSNIGTLTADKTPFKKRKLTATTVSHDTECFYLDVLFRNYYKTTSDASFPAVVDNRAFSFPLLQCIWPTPTVGVAFIKLITGLVSKPSLVVWKTLLYSLKELLAELQEKPELSSNALVHLDLHAALLCQYFSGSRLAEQLEKFSNEIADQRRLSADVLATFGRFLLAREHQTRTLKAFLECCYYAVSFQLLLDYYHPDGDIGNNRKCDKAVLLMHNFLTEEEWKLLEQRASNSENNTCQKLYERLLLQRVDAFNLLNPLHTSSAEKVIANESSLQKALSVPISIGRKQIAPLLVRTPHSTRFMSNVKREEKLQISAQVLTKTDLIDILGDDLEAVEFAALTIFEHLATVLACCKKSLLCALNCDFDAVRLKPNDDTIATDKQIQALVAVINARSNRYTLKNLPCGEIESALRTLKRLPLGWLRRQKKTLLFALQIALYCDMKACGADDLAAIAFETLEDLMHFGQPIAVFKYFSTESVLVLLPVCDCWPLYEAFFAGIRNEEKGTEEFFTALTEILRTAQADGVLDDDHRRLTLIAIETLGSVTGPATKRMRKYLKPILAVYAAYVKTHFDHATADYCATSEGDKAFVEKTLAGFAPYANAELTQATSSTDQATTVDDNFRRICKIYIGYSMDYRNPHAIRLMQVALNHRQQLHLDQDEIELVLSGYWEQLNADIKAQHPQHPQHQQLEQQLQSMTTDNVIEMIIIYKTNEDFLLTLKDIGRNITEKDFTQIARLLALIAKCPFGTVKGAIFDDQYKQITSDIALRMTKDERQTFINMEHMLGILETHRLIAENRGVLLTFDTLDTIIAFALDINIKKFELNDGSTPAFHKLHLAVSELATALIKRRHLLLMDRVPQFMHIFKDLLQSLMLYKSNRQNHSSLPSAEVDELAVLAQKMEALMHIIATHSIVFKRVAPFVLTFTINLMVANMHSTMLYPKIKTHIDNIAYELIGICDHRAGRFILRSSTEAARNMYELYVKDYDKYHKFKGKV